MAKSKSLSNLELIEKIRNKTDKLCWDDLDNLLDILEENVKNGKS